MVEDTRLADTGEGMVWVIRSAWPYLQPLDMVTTVISGAGEIIVVVSY